MYDKCIELEPDNATTYVHKGYHFLFSVFTAFSTMTTFGCPLVFTLLFVFRLLQLQWKQDLDLGLELISKAIEIDNKCDFAYETMGTIEVQR